MKAFAALTVALAFALPAATRVHASTAERTAVLRLATAHPVAFRGSSFLAGERVGVVVSTKARVRTRAVTASRAGTFLVRFVGMPFDRCDGLVAVARGARGSFATYKLPRPACPPGG